ncbi:MAG TPA: response regulator transcription factor [Anaerolineae bacterium]|nr:response regulator transcription factor [Anaerolineae bacterium]
MAELDALLGDLELHRVVAADVVRAATELQPRVIVLADPDPARGLRSVRRLRSAHTDARLLFITPVVAEQERLEALVEGVDESLAEPLAPSELAGRVRLLLHRARPVRRSRLLVGERLELDLERRQLLRDGVWVHLRPKEASLLELFARAPGRVLTRDHILERVWGPDHSGDPRTVDVHVRWLRSKIEPDPHDPVWLLTVRGVGYRLETVPLTKR